MEKHYLLTALLLTFIIVMSVQAQNRTYNVMGESHMVKDGMLISYGNAPNASFKMVDIEGGTFMMGATSEQKKPDSDEKPAHKVTLSDFCISETEVTQDLWQAVMYENPSHFSIGDGNMPVDNVSWEDCQTFIRKLNAKTELQRPKGCVFRLPTEAEWEFAARGGNKSKHTQYAGSNNLSSVAWYVDNSGHTTHPVAQKKANELGLYDMCGNVAEWCQDWYDGDYYNKSPFKNPCNNIQARNHVMRGGGSHYSAWACRVAYRDGSKVGGPGLRLAMDKKTDMSSNSLDVSFTAPPTRTYTAKSVSFKMIAVEGGSFMMGDEKAYQDAHKVTLSGFSIGETEVTQALWEAVMGSIPKFVDKGKDKPVYYVSWSECQQFIDKLNILTKDQRPDGRDFRLPTEAEWEYAARGGNKSNHTQYAGGNKCSSVAWYNKNSGNKPHPVAKKKANELGIYDMSGNVEEWCQDFYEDLYYRKSPSTNPCNNTENEYRVVRGGGYDTLNFHLEVSFRWHRKDDKGFAGLRLVL